MAGHAFAIRGPLCGQGARAEGILRALPDWFGDGPYAAGAGGVNTRAASSLSS